MGGERERRLGVFRIEGGEGRSGSQGSVYRAVCEGEFPGVAVGETVALKIMTAEYDPEAYARFSRRVAELSAIQNDHVVRYRGCFSAVGSLQTLNVAVMDWLDGWTLKERLEREPSGLDADEALRIADGILSGLTAAQAAGLVHRDVKPGNVFLGRDGSVKLIDFEVAHRTTAQSQSSTGGFAGTFDYMAPEFSDPEFRGTSASDVFAAGVVLHEMLTGQMPYARKTEKGEQADFAFLSRWSQRKEGLCAIRLKSSVKRVLSHADEVLLKALAEDAADRYPDAAAFRDDLRRIRYREVRSAADSYRLLRLVGEGGFGCVYKARSRGTGRFVAVKQLKRHEFGDRFRREARVMQRLDDPAFVRFVDYFETRDVTAVSAFLVMDFLPGMPGSSLRDAIRRGEGGPLPFDDVVTAFERYARALALMHRLRIYHRDVKPSNLYFPASDPKRSAIMDLGIARDVSGTATTGQVPGTLDYMPPEVVIGGSRGDAGMDIYALGLCLYEAISGCMGYPRLPTGPLAFSAFYERARSRRPPAFDSPIVRCRPQLLALLRDMTALDPRERLQDAELLRRRLEAVAKEVPVEDGAPVTSVSVATVTSPAKESPTRATANRVRPVSTKRQGVSPSDRPESRRWPWVAVATALAALSIAFGWKALVREDSAFLNWISKRNVNGILEKDDDRIRAEAEQLRKQALDESKGVLALFETNTVTAAGADAEASRWMIEWRDVPAVAGDFADWTNAFARARAKRLARDAAESAAERLSIARTEVEAIVEACRGTNEMASACDVRIETWRETWRGEIAAADFSELERSMSKELSERKNRDAILKAKLERERLLHQRRLEAAAEAVTAATGVEAAYADGGTPIDRANAAHATWRAKWRDVLDMPTVKEAENRIAAAHRRRASTEDGARVVAECGRHLDNILLVGPEHVKNWRDLVGQAEIALRQAERERRIGSEQAEALRRRIEDCRKWTVGVIDNKTDRTVSFGGQTIGPVTAAAVVFTNGYPVGTSLTSEGCEPIHVREERFASRIFTVMPRDLEERVHETRAVVPEIPGDILCLVDGVARKPGEISLRRGQHVVRYFRAEQTQPGVRDYDPKEYPFETRLSETVKVPSPTGEWSHSAAFKNARRNADLVAQARALESECRRLMAALPAETRRARLERVHALLGDWKTPAVLAVLGVGTEKKLRAEYDAERRRVRGHVRNETPYAATVSTDADPVKVPSGETCLVTFERLWPADAHVAVAGYEFVMLPREASAFDGTTFVVRPERLVPLPVRMTLPTLGASISCRVDGKEFADGSELRPGPHEVVYAKPDFVAQKIPFTVAVATPRTLPSPAKWEPTGAFSGLAAALKAFNSGAVDAAKQLTDGIGTVEDSERRRELEDLRRAIELRKRLEGKGK